MYNQTIFQNLEDTAEAVLEGLASGAFAEDRSGFMEVDQALLACESRKDLDAAIARKLHHDEVCAEPSNAIQYNDPRTHPTYHASRLLQEALKRRLGDLSMGDCMDSACEVLGQCFSDPQLRHGYWNKEGKLVGGDLQGHHGSEQYYSTHSKQASRSNRLLAPNPLTFRVLATCRISPSESLPRVASHLPCPCHVSHLTFRVLAMCPLSPGSLPRVTFS